MTTSQFPFDGWENVNEQKQLSKVYLEEYFIYYLFLKGNVVRVQNKESEKEDSIGKKIVPQSTLVQDIESVLKFSDIVGK